MKVGINAGAIFGGTVGAALGGGVGSLIGTCKEAYNSIKRNVQQY